ncbi:MAG TPA: hypothetical protein VMV10_23695 [Pirellulales bacterium]|nr:hypothetical protein [Pirellulales bacterium]
MLSRTVQAIRQGLALTLAVAGLGLFVFAAVALSGPGRIDVVDGLTRYEVARSLAEHGDTVIRDQRVTFLVFSGRGGRRYTSYRLPHSVLGVAAVALADLTGPVSEPRRHFFFSLVGAAACALLAAVFAVWFLKQGHSAARAILWSAGGIFCSPVWFYGTTTFDESLGAVTVVAALVVAVHARRATGRAGAPVPPGVDFGGPGAPARLGVDDGGPGAPARPRTGTHACLGAAAAGLLLGLAFNCKPPLAIFVLAALAGNADERLPLVRQRARLAWMIAGLALGVAAYVGYDLYKFPPWAMETTGGAAERYAPLWPGRPLFGLLGLTIGLGAGALWYWPPACLALAGLAVERRRERWFAPWTLAAVAIYVAFIATLSFFVGEPAWGPRYLTPAFAVLWLFAPQGAALLRRRTVAVLLAAGFAVQIAGLSVETVRLYIEEQWPVDRFLIDRWFYFRPLDSKLVQRPREIWEILTDRGPRAQRFTPAAEPTFPVSVPRKPIDVRRYHVLNSLRPWWASQQYLEPSQRPVDIEKTAALLFSLAGLGLAAVAPTFLRGAKKERMGFLAAMLE